jgi:hypothetical protein
MKLLGLRHDVVMKEQIQYLIFYDIDSHTDNENAMLEQIDTLMRIHTTSYIFYKTKHGYHLVGLTPMNALKWGSMFTQLQSEFKQYYGGIVIRLSRKPEEKQELLKIVLTYGEVIPNLYNLYCERFGMTKRPWIKSMSKHLLVFERYRTEKV